MSAADARSSPAGVASGLVLAALAGLAAAFFASHIGAVDGDRAVAVSYDWVPSLGVSLAFRLDGLSLLFAVLISGFGAVISLYALSYLRGHPQLVRFFLYLGLFMAGMLGLVLADDVIALFVFWEATTISSFLLVGFDHGAAKARRSAWQALLVTGAGGLALLAGLVILAIAAGTTRLSEISAMSGLTEHALYPVILALVLIGAFTKSAQIPFHFWLPNAMAAPTPVSAYLHSATMVKAGVYLLARLHPALSGTDGWTASLSFAGGATMLVTAFLALRQSDLKTALAYTSLMALGALVMFLGATATVAIAAAMTLLVVHALYKASLFMVVGAIDHQTGTREIARLGGLWRLMPMTSIAAVLAAGSMAGFPPFLGFIGKELKYEGALAVAEEPALLAASAMVANALMVALALTITLRVVFGQPGETPVKPREAGPMLWAPPLLLALFGLAFGIAPDLVGSNLIQPAVTAILGRPESVQLKMWHGVNVPLALSVMTMILGAIFFLAHRRMARLLARAPLVFDPGWDRLLANIAAGFKAITAVMQPGSLRVYMSVSLVAAALPALAVLVWRGGLRLPPPEAFAAMTVSGLSACALVAAGALTAALSQRRMAAIGGVGAAGTGIAALFVLYGAPDVAITQLLTDVLLVALIASAMARLPEMTPRREGRARDAAVAVVVGVAMGALTLAAASGGFDRSVADAMEALSWPAAHGRNVVNVILVDFRAIDTFGEIVVVAAAAIGAAALIGLRAGRGRA
ncbi:hydrogen gas-evolving membrane-bound hydrogenase subunit E [Rubrimonas cliftonensis]|uniref:Multisubunit sodium/proton antiporter, MrpA subunit n=1 Tax=Rubrimonas cliftonensis TaxID=89524 RepID=A0A1H4D3B2_9RHOB|nr:hydrogen gas-evolving membrane-bound hydrogenase subunit E [Rubrimonas cliftonensis]SEA67127.1 multisubunit sodium/proton antiporter, MrpA subunit [Rubrimonas cliftonensis]